jgi:phosphoglycolate phosphatase-like HAD superfamily hydrolase
MMVKKLCTAVLAAALGFGFMAGTPASEAATREEIAAISVNKKGSNFKYWNKDSAPYKALTSYVKEVTNKDSKYFIPVKDRVAVFDMDGTFLCETAPYYLDHMLFLDRTLHDANYKPSEDDREFALTLDQWLQNRDSSDNLGSSAPHQSSVFAGTTYSEYEAYVKKFIEKPVDGLSPLKWGEAFYLPMIEVMKYLRSNDFKIYVVSGSERELARILVCDLLDIPNENIIGTDIKTLAAHQGETDGLNYTYQSDDYLVRGGFVIKNLKMNKVSAIVREIGRQPVLAFGNSSGDSAMLNYTINGNKYKSAAFFLLCDDLERELGNLEKAEKCRKLADENGWIPVSMRDDFKTIYGDNVTRK